MTTDDTLGTLADLAECPEGSVITSAMVVVDYVDPDGDAAMAYAGFGDSLTTSRVGLLAWAQHVILTGQEF